MGFDVAAVVFILIFSLWNAKRGGVRAIMSLSGIVLSIIVAFSIYPEISSYIYEAGRGEKIYEAIYNVVSENADAGALTALPDFVKSIISVPAEVESGAICEAVSENLTEIAVNIISFVITLVATRIILLLAEWVLNIIMKLPVLKQLNRLIGFLCGGVAGIVIVFVAVHLLGIVAVDNIYVAAFMENSRVVEITGQISPF